MIQRCRRGVICAFPVDLLHVEARKVLRKSSLMSSSSVLLDKSNSATYHWRSTSSTSSNSLSHQSSTYFHNEYQRKCYASSVFIAGAETDNRQQLPESVSKTDHNIASGGGGMKKDHQQQSIVPGLLLAGSTAFGGFTIASTITALSGLPLSGIPVSILLGIGIRNYTPVLSRTDNKVYYRPGITTATKTVLQVGIVCVAAKLSLINDVFLTGSASIPVVMGSITAGMLFIPYCGTNIAGLSPSLSKLLAVGTSICGVTAITALAPAINASSRDVAVAVANTVAFGTVGMLLYPYFFHTFFTNGVLSSQQIGMCLGVSIHDTSQVLGAALSYKETYHDDIAFQVAAVTKLLRNLGLAITIPVLTYVHHKEQEQKEVKPVTAPLSHTNNTPLTLSGLNTFTKYVPTFLVAFLGMSAFRSTGDLLLLSSPDATDVVANNFTTVMDYIGNDCSKYALGTAMAGVGLSTTIDSLKGVGWKPFAVGLSGAFVVGGTGITIATLMV